MVTTIPAQEHHQRSRIHVLPHSPLGWWGLGLTLFALVGCPGLWALSALIKFSDPNTYIRTALTIAIAVPSLVVGALALFRRDARSVLLIAVWSLVALLFAWVVLFAATID